MTNPCVILYFDTANGGGRGTFSSLSANIGIRLFVGERPEPLWAKAASTATIQPCECVGNDGLSPGLSHRTHYSDVFFHGSESFFEQIDLRHRKNFLCG